MNMKKHPSIFMEYRKCFILLLFVVASIQAFKDNENCEAPDAEGVTCQKSPGKDLDYDHEDPEILKSVFSENHDCEHEDLIDGSSDVDESGHDHKTEDSDGDNEGSCNASEKSDCIEVSPEEEEKMAEPDSSSSIEEEAISKKADETEEEESDGEIVLQPDVQIESPEEGRKEDSDPDSGNVPLREILLKLKPEGLTDNDDDEQASDFSVTEASMGEEEEVEEENLVSSGSAEKQETGLESSSNDSTKNGSGSGLNKKAICSEVNVTETVGDVEIINATLLMKFLQGNPNVTNRSSSAPCHLIYFFSPHCPFSVAGSPYVNAMARSLKNIPVYGLDSIEYHSVNARYGVMGTPTLLLFHNGNGVGRYNASEFSVMQLLSFINHYTDQSILDINVTSADFRAVLPAQLKEGRPYALWACWIFLLSIALWVFLTSDFCARLAEAVLNNWREAEAQNDQD